MTKYLWLSKPNFSRRQPTVGSSESSEEDDDAAVLLPQIPERRVLQFKGLFTRATLQYQNAIAIWTKIYQVSLKNWARVRLKIVYNMF